MEYYEWKNDIHVTKSNVRPYPGNERKFLSHPVLKAKHKSHVCQDQVSHMRRLQ